MIALDAHTGKLSWSYSGRNAAYASPILNQSSEAKLILDFDEVSSYSAMIDRTLVYRTSDAVYGVRW